MDVKRMSAHGVVEVQASKAWEWNNAELAMTSPKMACN